MILASQSRAARALLGWSQRDLAARVGASHPTIANFETGKQTPQSRTMRDITKAFTEAGIRFSHKNGIVSVHFRTDAEKGL